MKREHRQAALAVKLGADAAGVAFEALSRKHKDPDRYDEAVDKLLEANGIDPYAPEVPAEDDEAWRRGQAFPTAAQLEAVSEEPAPPAAEPPPHPGREHLEGGFVRVPMTVVDELLPAMSEPALRAYLYCCRIADRRGQFYVAHATLAARIGCRSRQHGERIMRQLAGAGLIVRRWRGGPGRSNGYALAGIRLLDLDRARRVLSEPLTKKQPQRLHDKQPERSHE